MQRMHGPPREEPLHVDAEVDAPLGQACGWLAVPSASRGNAEYASWVPALPVRRVWDSVDGMSVSLRGWPPGARGCGVAAVGQPQVVAGAGQFAGSEHERLLAALKASRSGTWRWTIAEDRVEWDEALCQVYGLPPERAPTTSGEFLSLIHPDDREHAWSQIRACIEEGRDADYQFRTVVGGEERWIYDRSALVRNPDGSPAYMLGACLDVTERRRIQQERDAALEKQKLLLKELSHRVKNHLGMIVSLLRLKQSRQKDPIRGRGLRPRHRAGQDHRLPA